MTDTLLELAEVGPRTYEEIMRREQFRRRRQYPSIARRARFRAMIATLTKGSSDGV